MDYEEISLKNLFCSSCGHFKPSGVRYVTFGMAVQIKRTYFSKLIEEFKDNVETSVDLTSRNHYRADWAINIYIYASKNDVRCTTMTSK